MFFHCLLIHVKSKGDSFSHKVVCVSWILGATCKHGDLHINAQQGSLSPPFSVEFLLYFVLHFDITWGTFVLGYIFLRLRRRKFSQTRESAANPHVFTMCSRFRTFLGHLRRLHFGGDCRQPCKQCTPRQKQRSKSCPVMC